MSFEIQEGEIEDVEFDEESKIISSKTETQIECNGLGYEFFNLLKKFQDNIFQYNVDTEATDTYGEILQLAIKVALNLKDRDLDKDDIVCLCSYNHSYNTLPLLASLFLNIRVSSLDPSFQIQDAVHLLKMTKPKICFLIPESIKLIYESLEEAGVKADIVVYDHLESYENLDKLLEGTTLDKSSIIPFSHFLEEHKDENHFIPEKADPNDTCCIYFSSGSTGLPKGVCLNSKALFQTGCSLEAKGLLDTKPSVILIYSGFYWISAIFGLSMCLVSGASRIVCKAFDPVNFWKILDEYKVTYAFLSPFQAYNIISVGRPENIDTTSLTVIVTGGSHFEIGALKTLRDLMPGTFIVQNYGSTEAGFLSAFNLRRVQERLFLHYKPESCGRPMYGFQYKVVDPETNQPCGYNEKGELRIKSDFLFNGYYELESSNCFDEDGFFQMGDVAYFDEEFCFYVVDRIKELLKYRNMQISPAYIEQVLQSHPAVRRALVIGIPHEIDGDHPMAIVIIQDGQEDITGKSLEEYVNERVNDAHQLRGGVKFVKAIPLTPSGKVKRNELKQMILKDRFQN